MAITYHAGRRIQGISITPRQAGSGLTFSDDFSSDKGWETSSSTYMDYDSGNSRLKTVWKGDGAGNNYTVVYDLGEGMVSDTKWILRTKINFGTTSGADNEGFIGLSDSDKTAGRETAQDFAGVCFLAGYSTTAWNGFYECEADGVILPPTAGNNAAYNFSDSTDYWLEIKRTSATGLTYTVYSDAYSTSLATQSVTIASTVSGLRYIKFSNYPTASTNCPNAYADDVQFYNDVTSTSTTPVAEIPASGDTKPTNVQAGSRFEETDTRKMYYKFDANAYHSEVWYEAGTVPYAGGRGVFGGGNTSGNTMDYITIATPSNATDFGDLTVSRLYIDAVSSLTRGVIGGGWNGSANEDTMDYITFSTPSNATDFGNLTVARHALAGVSSGTRGVFGGFGGALTNVIDYITIATEGNATDFGDLTVARQDLAGVSSDTRGVFAGGDNKNQMDYITISTTGNATDFGDLLTTLRYPAGVSNGIRGVFAGGDPNSGQGNTDVIQYITIATTGNSTDFGDLIVGRHAPAGVNSDTRGVIGGGYSGGNSNVMEYITIATTGNATDFGDLTVARNHLAGASRF